ncbi:hypothetical protein BMI86_09595 [Thioclava sp. DLFJ5-1]|uniref:Mth938-like domain-containing protein n=1 Tax=Thioclava sp. DLFJ5-1 TaxID=1915314 RepID=UPI0009974012|nr:Mth938-like domain-containing protein [Thioclava sp. DLFJ5-1]OOY20762.1 hypothetical protein BMI86_09595 [Thioclava sp. DLFJ5-1]
MSLLTEANFGASLPIDGYGPGFFRVAGEVTRGSIWVAGEEMGSWGGLDDRAPLRALADKLDVLFIGTGEEIAHLPKDLVAELEAEGLMCEGMATPSAARTYNVLLSEGRRVGCALIAIPENPATPETPE